MLQSEPSFYNRKNKITQTTKNIEEQCVQSQAQQVFQITTNPTGGVGSHLRLILTFILSLAVTESECLGRNMWAKQACTETSFPPLTTWESEILWVKYVSVYNNSSSISVSFYFCRLFTTCCSEVFHSLIIPFPDKTPTFLFLISWLHTLLLVFMLEETE